MKYRFRLIESKEDIQRFIDKFGQEVYDKFNKLKGRLKNNNMSVDYTWYVKNVNKEDLEQTLSDLENRVVKDDSGETRLNRKKVAENDKCVIWDVLDWQTAMNMGDGTVWCITGRYDTDEVKPSQAKTYFNEYKERGVTKYLFFMPKNENPEDKYCLVLYKKELIRKTAELWNCDDIAYQGDEINFKLQSIGSPDFSYNGFEYDWNSKEYVTERDGLGCEIVKYLQVHNKNIVISEDVDVIFS